MYRSDGVKASVAQVIQVMLCHSPLCEINDLIVELERQAPSLILSQVPPSCFADVRYQIDLKDELGCFFFFHPLQVNGPKLILWNSHHAKIC